MLLQVLTTALQMDSLQGTEKPDHWPTLYNSFGRLTLGDSFNEGEIAQEGSIVRKFASEPC